MAVLDKIAHLQGRRDEVPNQELARALAETEDRAGIQEIAENLWQRDPAIQSDCLKVLYEIGYLNPTLIADYVDDFVRLACGKNNRLAWGGMIALSTIASLQADVIDAQFERLLKAIERGSVITIDNGVKTLALVAAHPTAHRPQIIAFLLDHLAACRPKDVPQHAEHALAAIAPDNQEAFVQVLEKRLPHLSPSQAARVQKVLSKARQRHGAQP